MTLRLSSKVEILGATDDTEVLPLDEADTLRYRRLFDVMCDDRLFVEVDELENLLSGQGLLNTRNELQSIIKTMQLEFTSRIGFDEFQVIMHRLVSTSLKSGRGALFLGKGSRVNGLRGLRKVIWSTMDDPSYTFLAKIVSLVVMMTIFVSSVAFILESMPDFRSGEVHDALVTIDVIAVVIFSVEYVLRIASTPNLCQFLVGFMNAVDLFAVLPFYVELAVGDSDVGSTSFLRTLRLVRVFRIFKISRYLSWLKLIIDACAASLAPLGMAMVITLISNIVLSSALYYIERGTWDQTNRLYINALGERSNMQSIVDAMYWSCISMTTVGYGNDVAFSFIGRLVAGIICWSGILLLAIPISVFSANFANEYNRMVRRRKLKKEQNLDILLQVQNGVPRHLRAIRSFASKRFYQSFDQSGATLRPPLISASEFASFDLTDRQNLDSAIRTVTESSRKRMWWDMRRKESVRRQELALEFGKALSRWFQGDERSLSMAVVGEIRRKVTQKFRSKALGLMSLARINKSSPKASGGSANRSFGGNNRIAPSGLSAPPITMGLSPKVMSPINERASLTATESLPSDSARTLPALRVAGGLTAEEAALRQSRTADPAQLLRRNNLGAGAPAGSTPLTSSPLDRPSSKRLLAPLGGVGSPSPLRPSGGNRLQLAPLGGVSSPPGSNSGATHLGRAPHPFSVGDDSEDHSDDSEDGGHDDQLIKPTSRPRRLLSSSGAFTPDGAMSTAVGSDAESAFGSERLEAPASMHRRILAPLAAAGSGSGSGEAAAASGSQSVETPKTVMQRTEEETITKTTRTMENGVTVTHSSIVRVIRTTKEGPNDGTEPSESKVPPMAAEGDAHAAATAVALGQEVPGVAAATHKSPQPDGVDATAPVDAPGASASVEVSANMEGKTGSGYGEGSSQQVRESTFEH